MAGWASNPLALVGHTLSLLYVIVIGVFSGFVINGVQASIWVAGRTPVLSRKQSADWNRKLSTQWWNVVTFLMEGWGNVPYRFTGDVIDASTNALLISNHGPGLDLTTGVVLTSRTLGTGKVLTLLKKELQWVPALGWSHFFQGSLFLTRKWDTDKQKIRAKLAQIEAGKWPEPYQIGIYPEGTRITEKKRAASHIFAAERGLPVLNNVLLPRTKGFLDIMSHLPSNCKKIYDFTIGYGKSGLYPKEMLTKGGFSCDCVHIHVREMDVSELPKDETKLKDWLMADFVEKDKLLDHLHEHGQFPGQHNNVSPNFFLYLNLTFLIWSCLWLVCLDFLASGHLRHYGMFISALLTAYTLCKSIVQHKEPDQVLEAKKAVQKRHKKQN
jgi:1-acyl-sn-glycerol-3-phosphate acyltransferase